MNFISVVIYVCDFILITGSVKSRTLSEVLNYYETLHVDDVLHNIVRRNTFESNTHERHLTFTSHSRQFHLRLTTSVEVFASDFQAVTMDSKGVEEKLEINQNNFYKGYLLEDYSSSAVAHVEDNMITASVTTYNDTYIIEPMFPHVDENKELYKNKMIVYKVSDLNWNLTHSNSSIKISHPSPTCEVDSAIKFVIKDGLLREKKQDKVDRDNLLHNKTMKSNSRQKRNVFTSKTRCNLVLVCDYLFYRQMGESATFSVNYMLQVATFVNDIYTRTVWSEDLGSGIGFQVKKVIVHKEFSIDSPSYNQQKSNGPWSVDELLNQFSRSNWEAYCLAHLFTYQDFAKGVIGLAYVAGPGKQEIGGICTTPYRDIRGARYLNCGLSSGENWGRQLLTREAQLVTAHELGHNFGSSHDQSNCEEPGGKFIMYATSVSGDKSNNDKFSHCSKAAIAKVLRSKRTECFSDIEGNFCGNQKVDDSEECDSGFAGEEDNCCHQCKLKKGMKCSPLNSPCCNQKCQFADTNTKCRPMLTLECKASTYCTGIHAKCPNESPKLEDDQQCGLTKGNCLKGRGCVSLCEQYNKTSCLCAAGSDSCKVCCLNAAGGCVPLQLKGYTPVQDNDGVPCQLSDSGGYCNKGVCEKIQTKVKNEFSDLLKDFTFSKFVRFMEANIVGSIIILSLFFWIPLACIVHYLDKQQDEEHEEMKNWLNPFNKELIQKSAAVNKVRMLFHRRGQTDQTLPRTQYHIPI